MDNFDRDKKIALILKGLPDASGVYMMKDCDGQVIYVGKALSLKKRVSSYFHSPKQHTAKTLMLVRNICDIEVIVTANEIEALILEANLIKKFRPHFNIRLKDDKRYPFVEITLDLPFPQIRLARKKTGKKNRVFGPYLSGESVKKIIEVVKRLFRLRTCKDRHPLRQRPCLNYQMGKCSGPCAAFADREAYSVQVKHTLMFLEGHTEKIIASLKEEMQRESEKMNFERCARILSDLRAVEKLTQEQKAVFPEPVNRDYIAWYGDGGEMAFQLLKVRNGKLIEQGHFIFSDFVDISDEEKARAFILSHYSEDVLIPPSIYVMGEVGEKALLESWLSEKSARAVKIFTSARSANRGMVELAYENALHNLKARRVHEKRDDRQPVLIDLAKALSLPKLPRRIETYDISNISGKMAVGSMVVFTDGKPDKANYRRFRIRLKDSPDDFAMMQETFDRRFTVAKAQDKWKETLPDLIVVDGGKGQLSSVVEILRARGVGVPVISLAKKNEEVFLPGKSEPVILDRTSPMLNLLKYCRDEAHRFAVTYHRKLRLKAQQQVFKQIKK